MHVPTIYTNDMIACGLAVISAFGAVIKGENRMLHIEHDGFIVQLLHTQIAMCPVSGSPGGLVRDMSASQSTSSIIG